MALDEYLYRRISNYFRGNKSTSSDIENRLVSLEGIKQKLTILARALSGDAIEIFPAEREGGYKDDNLFVPTSCSLFPSLELNRSFYFFRVFYLVIQRKLNINLEGTIDAPVELAREMAKQQSRIVLTHLFTEYPMMESIHSELEIFLISKATPKSPLDDSWLYGKLMLINKPVVTKELNNFSEEVKTALLKTEQTVIQARAVEEVKTIEVDKKQQEDYVLTHNFEKVDTAEEFSGVWRDFDGDDELEDHQEALDELNMKFTVRVDDAAHSIYQAEFTENTTISESAETVALGPYISYDEWDYAKLAYRINFCKVYPIKQLKIDSFYYKKTISEHGSTLMGLRKLLANSNTKFQQQHKQPDGDEIDIDLLTDVFTEIKSRRTPSEKIYLTKRKKEKEISIQLLLDISLSSDGYAAGNRVIDVEKQVSILFGEIMNEFNIDFGISCFYSKTRNHTTILTLKDFDEDWNIGKHKIGAITPNGYTRIGAAIRHSGANIARRRNKNKWVVLLSDGKPNDYDKYEGKYGIQDVKQAIRELKSNQVNCYALAIEAQAKYYLPQMFGTNHYQILTSPIELLLSMVKLYEKIRHQS